MTIDYKFVAKMRLILQPVFKYRVFLWEVFRELTSGGDYRATAPEVLSHVDSSEIVLLKFM